MELPNTCRAASQSVIIQTIVLTMPGSEVAQIAQPDDIPLPSALPQPELSSPTPTTGTQSNRVSKVLELFDQHREGSIDRDRRWIETRLQPEEYKDLLQTLDKNEDLSAYVHDNIQYEYDPNRSLLIITMPSPLHRLFIAKILTDIQIQLRVIALTASGIAADIAKHIELEFSSNVQVTGNTHQSSSAHLASRPDAAFRFKADEYARVVLEVSCPQKRKELPQMAKDYILGSEGNVGTVIGLEINHNNTNEGRLSIWRPKPMRKDHHDDSLSLELEEVQCQAFRNADGTSGSADLNLQLRDFILPIHLEDVSEDDQARWVKIPATKLTLLLNEAEEASTIKPKKHKTAQNSAVSDTRVLITPADPPAL